MNDMVQSLVSIIVFIAVVSGIVSSIKESMAAKAKPRNVPKAGQSSRAQSEIAAFLGASPAPTQQQRPQAQQRPPQQRPVKQQTGPQQQTASQRQPKQRKPQRTPGTVAPSPPADRTRVERPPGSAVREHVESYIGAHVKAHMGRDVDAFVKKDIDERVKSHLGSQSSQAVEMAAPSVGDQAATDLLKALKSPEGVRQAILVSEILSRPRALRR
jgi:hypothetical protein